MVYMIGGSTDGSAGGAGKLASSIDGTSGSWTLLTTPIDGHVNTSFYGLVCNGVRWVASGFWTGTLGGITTNRFISSDDGINWTIRSSPLDGSNWSCRGIVWAKELNLFIAICGNATNVATILTSPDGITWTQRTISSIGPLEAIGWNGSLLVVGSNTGGIATSPDGITWTQRTGQPIDKFKDVVWAESLGLWVGVGHSSGNKHVFTSPDGITWTERSSPSSGGDSHFAIGWNGTGLVAIGYVSGAWSLITSADGVTWVSRTHAFTGTSASSEGSVSWIGTRWLASVLPNGTSSVGVITSTDADGITWSADTTGLSGGAAVIASGVTPSEASYIIAGSNSESSGGGKLASSLDGSNGSWTPLTTPVDGHINAPFMGLASNGSRLVAGGAWNGNLGGVVHNRIIYSDDGVTWNIGTTPLDAADWTLRKAIWVADLGIFVVACLSSTNHTTFLTSPDGITWTERTAPTATAPKALAWNGSLLVCGTDSGQILTSPDGITWTVRRDPGGDGYSSILDIVWAGGSINLWVAGGSGPPFSFPNIFTSPDGITWTDRSGPSFGNPFAIGWNGSMLVALGYTSGSNTWGLATSTNGTSWTSRTIPLTGLIGSYIGQAYWTGTKWLVGLCPRSGNPGLITSSDGITWSTITIGSMIEAARISKFTPPMRSKIGIPI